MIANPVIQAKIDSLNRCLLRIKSKTPASSQQLIEDLDLQDIITLNLSRAVQLSVDISTHLIAELSLERPDTMGGTMDILVKAKIIQAHTGLQLKKAIGFRNIAVHNYEAINWELVYSIITQQLQDFILFSSEIDHYLATTE